MVGWLSCLSVIALLWCYNWKLFLATSVGIGSMSMYYLWSNSHWQRYCQKWQKFLSGLNRQFIFAVSSGAVGSFCTYLAASVWADAENQWLATGAILQGFASLTTLSVLLWSLGSKKNNTAEIKFDNLLADLSHEEPLKRLIAVRQLTRQAIANKLTPDCYSQLEEYFYLMLSEPQKPIIKNALLESLELLDTKQAPKLKPQAVRIPINLQRSHKQIKTLQDS